MAHAPSRSLATADFETRLDEVRDARTSRVLAFLAGQRALILPLDQNQMEWHELSVTKAVGTALLEHRVRSAALYASQNNFERFMELLGCRSQLNTYRLTKSGRQFAVAMANLGADTPNIGESPGYLIGSNTTDTPAYDMLRLVEGAILAVTRFGSEALFESAGAIVVVNKRGLFETSNSWTTTAMPGTIYTDWISDPIALGCTLIHEAGHLWLNDAFRAVGFPTRDDVLFPSPWKGVPRPRFAFLHAVFAFSLVASYCREVISAHGSEQSEGFVESMRIREIGRLNEVRSLVDAALKGADENISHAIRFALEGALAAP